MRRAAARLRRRDTRCPPRRPAVRPSRPKYLPSMVSMANWTLQSWPRLSQRKPNLMVQVSYTYFKQIFTSLMLLMHNKLFAFVNIISINEEIFCILASSEPNIWKWIGAFSGLKRRLL
jgi:hypothetical protein